MICMVIYFITSNIHSLVPSIATDSLTQLPRNIRNLTIPQFNSQFHDNIDFYALGLHFPYVGRDDLLFKLATKIYDFCEIIRNYSRESTIDKHHHDKIFQLITVIGFAGMSGIGKTRSAFELFKYLCTSSE